MALPGMTGNGERAGEDEISIDGKVRARVLPLPLLPLPLLPLGLPGEEPVLSLNKPLGEACGCGKDVERKSLHAGSDLSAFRPPWRNWTFACAVNNGGIKPMSVHAIVGAAAAAPPPSSPGRRRSSISSSNTTTSPSQGTIPSPPVSSMVASQAALSVSVAAYCRKIVRDANPNAGLRARLRMSGGIWIWTACLSREGSLQQSNTKGRRGVDIRESKVFAGIESPSSSSL
jgi:hypothetical protein